MYLETIRPPAASEETAGRMVVDLSVELSSRKQT
jgi:hypothetical protein